MAAMLQSVMDYAPASEQTFYIDVEARPFEDIWHRRASHVLWPPTRRHAPRVDDRVELVEVLHSQDPGKVGAATGREVYGTITALQVVEGWVILSFARSGRTWALRDEQDVHKDKELPYPIEAAAT